MLRRIPSRCGLSSLGSLSMLRTCILRQSMHLSSIPSNGISHVHGPTTTPLIEECIGNHVEKKVMEFGDATLLTSCHQNLRLSWKEFLKRSDQIATALHKLGYERGDRFGVWLPTLAEWTILQVATARIGVILVNINPSYTKTEIKYAINLVGVKGILVKPEYRGTEYLNILSDLCPELLTKKIDARGTGGLYSTDIPSLRHVCVTELGEAGASELAVGQFKGAIPYEHLQNTSIDSDMILNYSKNLSIHDAINIQFTSGTTGPSKAATLTHHGILNNGFFAGRIMGLSPSDRLCVPVPLMHCFGSVLGNLAAFTNGSELVYPGMGFNPIEVFKAVSTERCTGLHGVPTMFISLLSHPDFVNYELSSLRTGIMAGSLCPEVIMHKVIDKMHMSDVSICYGMTETSPISFQTPIHATEKNRCETVGIIHPHAEVKIVDENDSTVPIGVAGELLTKGYLVMKGYWDQEVATTKSITSDGFMRTGDLATIDSDGYARIIGRKKDLIIRGGENIFPKEIEDSIRDMPGVRDVAVVGVSDELYGEEICAWVIPMDDKAVVDDKIIRTWCRKHMAKYKAPRFVHIVKEFPLTTSGKVKKFEIKMLMENMMDTVMLKEDSSTT